MRRAVVPVPPTLQLRTPFLTFSQGGRDRRKINIPADGEGTGGKALAPNDRYVTRVSPWSGNR